MRIFKLKNPRKGVKSAYIAVRGDGIAMLVVDFTRDPETGRQLPGEMKTVQNSGLTLRGTKIVYCKRYHSLKKGKKRPTWEEEIKRKSSFSASRRGIDG